MESGQQVPPHEINIKKSETIMVNKVTLIGRVGKDAEVKGQNGNFCTFTLATSERYQVNNEWKEDTQWHNIAYFGQNAQKVAERVKKGMLLYVEGSIVYRQYENKDGQKVTATEIKTFMVRSLEKSQNAQAAAPANAPAPQSAPQANAADDDDLPF